MSIDRREFLKISAMAAVASQSSSLRAEADAMDSVDFIKPVIGASTSVKLGESKTFPGATTPFGMVQLSPDTITGGDNAPGYSYDHSTIEGFSFARMSGVGWFGDFGNLQVMPTTGELKTVCGHPDRLDEGWRSPYRHTNEVAECGYYAVALDRYRIRAEMTAAAKAGILRFTFPREEKGRIQIDLARRIGGTSTQQFVRVIDSQTIEGWMECPSKGGGWGNGEGHVNYTLYFHMSFSRPFQEHGVWTVKVPSSLLAPGKDLIADRFQTWSVPHDVYGLIEQMGSERFVSELEDFFEKTPTSFGWNPHYNHANEPVHHVPYLFVYAGKPWLTQKWVRRIMDQAYKPTVDGICGNDDVGQMPAWYIMSAMGLYPVCPGSNVYVLGAPLFGRVNLKLDRRWHSGGSFAIIARGNSATNVYVQAARLNGTPLTRSWIRHEEIVRGGTLEFEMGSEPNREWASRLEDRPPDTMKL